MSRKRLPTRVTRLRGTLRSDRSPGADPIAIAPELAPDVAPPELAADPEALAEWHRALPRSRTILPFPVVPVVAFVFVVLRAFVEGASVSG